MITIKHTHADGTLIYGTSKGDGVYEIVKRFRFRYFPSIRMIGIGQSRDQLAKRWQIDSAADALRAAGFDVEVEIDDTPRDRAEVKADQAERLDARYDRLTARAQRLSAEASARFDRADQISERFAGGQPILVGHHSERRARADHKRMDQAMRAGVAAQRDAEHAAAAASVVGSNAAYRERPPVIIRRIAKTEADLRKVQHQIDGTRPANDWRGAYYAPERRPASGAWLDQLNARKAFYEAQLAADREALAEHEASGYRVVTRADVHPGDTITDGHWWGTAEKVVRVNQKTVSVETGYSWTRKVSFEQIKSVTCPHENRTVKVGAPPAAAAREPVTVTVEKPPEREAPVTVDARFEFFPTPAPVVEQMIDAAEIEPGMTVLEPSAGTGAIAAKAVEAGATVHCVEFSATLAERLRAAGFSFEIADFLTVTPQPLYDRVLMNPPFGNQADIRHVTHALGFVKPGGRLVAVMSAGVEFRENKATVEFRKLVADRGGWIERLPDNAFESSGTSVRTVLAVIPVNGLESLQ